jgi:hypothetical protein
VRGIVGCGRGRFDRAFGSFGRLGLGWRAATSRRRLVPRFDKSFSEAAGITAIETPFLGEVGPVEVRSPRAIEIPARLALARVVFELRRQFRGLWKLWAIGAVWCTRFTSWVARRLAGVARGATALALSGRGFRIVAQGAFVVLRFDVGNVQKAVSPHREIDECGLDGGFDVDDPALVDVAGVILVVGALDIELFEHAIFDDGDAALFGLQDVDEHFFFHRLVSVCG